MKQTVVGVFDRFAAARHAAMQLQQNGFDEDCVHVTGNESATAGDAHADEGVLGHMRAFFADLFGQEDTPEASQYTEAVRRGSAVVTVDVDEEAKAEQARLALQQAGAVDIDARAEQWRAAGWNDGQTSDGQTRNRSAGSAEGVIPVVREELNVGKRTVETGGVRVYARTVETPVEESVQLRTEHADVQRRQVDRPATEAELANLEDRTIEVREMAEKPVVQKTARVVEEVSVGKQVDQRTETIRDTVHNTQVEVQPLGAGRRAYADYDADFRQDFATRYGTTGARYEEYQPAYQYGHQLAGDARYRGRSWDDIEANARSDWESSHPGSAWERFKAAVRHAWEHVTD